MTDTATVRLGLVLATNDQLLEELQQRGLIVCCSAEVTVDGRFKSRAKSDSYVTFLELRLLETMAKAMAVAQASDRVHTFSRAPAGGDMPPGSEVARIDMLAIRLNPEVPDAAAKH